MARWRHTVTILDEGKCIQKWLGQATIPSNSDAIAQTFRDLMLQGKVQNALRYLSRKTKLEDLVPETTKNGESILKSTGDILKEKHPLGKDSDACCLVDGEFEPVNPITFDGLDADAIRHAAHARGSWPFRIGHGEDSAPLSSLPRIICVSLLLVLLVALLPPVSTLKV